MLDPCFYCGRGLVPAGPKHPPNEYTIDHVLPVSRGGEHRSDNIVAACRQCNDKKGARTLEEYRELVYMTEHRHFRRMAIGMRLAAAIHPSHLSFELVRLAQRFENPKEFVIFEGEKTDVFAGDGLGDRELENAAGHQAGATVDR